MDKEQEGINVYDYFYLDLRFFFLGVLFSYRKEYCVEEFIKVRERFICMGIRVVLFFFLILDYIRKEEIVILFDGIIY